MMDSQHAAVTQQCLDAAHDGTMPFPKIVGALMEAGFEGYLVDYRQNTTIYYHPTQGCVVLENRPSDALVGPEFDAGGVAANIKWARTNPPEYSYAAFCKNVKAAGCAGYLVWFPGRRVVYYGRTGETHVEHFPQ